MALTQAQLATLKAAIDADPALAAKPLNGDGYFDIAQILNNQVASPDFWVWRTAVDFEEIRANGFDWVRVDNLTPGKARIWEWMFKSFTAPINPSKVNDRAGIAEVWKGTAADNAVRGVVFGHCQMKASRAQKLFAVGAGTSTTIDGAGPATMEVIALTPLDVEQARALP